MVRYGRCAGLAGLLLLSWLAGCNNDADNTAEPPTSGPSAGGGAPSFTELEQAVGRVLVVGKSAGVPHFEREYRGLAESSSASTDSVRCQLDARADGFVVSIEAAQGSSPTPQFAARWLTPSLGPTSFDIAPSAADENALRVRLGDGDAFSFYEYDLDSSGDPISLCSVGLISLDRDQVLGKAACRRLEATSASQAPASQGGASNDDPDSASVTFDFSCPFRALSAPGSGGSSSVGGSTSTAGTGQAGSATAGTSSFGGTGGVIEKRCVGVTTPCSLRDSISCQQGNGCTLDEDCTGFSSSCYGQIGVYSCTAIQGCVWASSSKSCIGSAWSCSSFSGSLSCTGQPGCNWHSDCTGLAPLCSSLSEFTCGLEPGCRWE